MTSPSITLDELQSALAGLSPRAFRLSPPIRAAYEGSRRSEHILSLRRVLLAILAMNLFCLIVDAQAGSQILRLGLLLRVGIYAPVAVLAVVYLRRPRGSRLLAGLAAATPMFIDTVIAMLLARSAKEPFSDRYLLGVALGICFQSVLAPVPFRYALGGLLASVAAFCSLALAPLSAHWSAPISPDLPIFLSGAALSLIYEMCNRHCIDRKDFLLREIDSLRLAQMLQINARLERLSNVDALTGIFNRRHIDSALPRLWELARRRRRSIGLLMIDIDHFKLVNDNLGHPHGDFCLEQVAHSIEQCVRVGIDTVGRYGGEEFLVILPEADQGETCAVGERIRTAIEALSLPGYHRTITVSIGATAVEVVEGSLSPQQHLVAQADQALYTAKRAGRNRLAWATDQLAYAIAP